MGEPSPACKNQTIYLLLERRPLLVLEPPELIVQSLLVVSECVVRRVGSSECRCNPYRVKGNQSIENLAVSSSLLKLVPVATIEPDAGL